MRALALLPFLLTSLARADVAPEPGRPEWSDTPLPQPTEPEEIAVFALALVLMAVGAWFLRDRLRDEA